MGIGDPFPKDIDPESLERPALLELLPPVTDTGHLTVRPRGPSEVWNAAWAPDGSHFAWSCGHALVKVLRVKPGIRYTTTNINERNDNHTQTLTQTIFDETLTRTLDAGDRVWSLSFGSRRLSSPFSVNVNESSKQNKNLNWFRYKESKDLILAVGLNNGRIKVYDVETGVLYLELMDHKDVVRDLSFSPNGAQILVSASRDGTLKVWELQDDGNMKQTLPTTSKWLYACQWSPNATMLASVGDNRSALLWDMRTYTLLHRLVGHQNDVCGCCFSPDGALLATSSCDTRVIIWDTQSGQKYRELFHLYPPPSLIYAGGANDSSVRDVTWSRDGVHLATVSDDSYLRFWDLSKPDLPCQAVTVNNALCCRYSPDGATLAVGTRQGAISLWQAPMRVQSLQTTCRAVIRRSFTDQCLSRLLLPCRLKHFVQQIQDLSDGE